MPRVTELSLNERNFVLQALRENIRLDGRAFDAFRAIELTFGDEDGFADVRLGKTRYDTQGFEVHICLSDILQCLCAGVMRGRSTLCGPEI